ncbi:MAG: hypothetical protein K1X56_04980 [Flavobacteriales bacterium]|nr:hypothetical protein [Flavobacteriales bacterium]
MRKLLLILAATLFLLSFVPSKRISLSLSIIHTYQGKIVKPGDTLFFHNGAPVKLNVLKYYISDVSFSKKNGGKYADYNKTHLIDFSSDTTNIVFGGSGNADVDTLAFYLGIDSSLSCSGVHEGDLDPVKGMYWTWQSGYINLKLEGIHPLSPTRDHGFQFHLGGYRNPFSAIQRVALPVNEKHILLEVKLEHFLNAISVDSLHTVMSPGENAVKLSKQAITMFRAHDL